MAGTCRLDNAGRKALCVASDSRLSLYDVAGGLRDATHFSEKAHLLSGYNCIAWCPSNSTASESRSLVALGAQAGVIVIWDVDRAEVLHRFGGDSVSSHHDAEGVHTARIVDIQWCTSNDDGATNHTLFTCAEGSGSVNEWRWDGQSGASHRPRLSRTFNALKRGVTRLSAPPSSPGTLFAAGDDVAVVDLSSGKRVARLAGHSTPATSLAMASDGTVLVSAADERVLHLWDVEAGAASAAGQVRAPTCTLAHPGRPLPSTVRVLKAKKNVYHVLAVGEDGTACIWRYKRSKGEGETAAAPTSTKPIPPSCTVTLDTTEYDAASAKRRKGLQADKPAIIAAELIKDDVTAMPTLVAALGPLAAPTFYRASYTPSDDASRPVASLPLSVRPPSGSTAAQAAGADSMDTDDTRPAKTSATGTEAVAEARGAAGARASNLADASAQQLGKKRKRQEDEEGAAASQPDDFAGVSEADIDGEWTLGRNVQAVIAALRNPGATDILAAAQGGKGAGAEAAAAGPTSTSDALLATGSLASVLTQALTAGDDAQLELVLSSGDKGVQDATVSRLPPNMVLTFLARLVARFQAKPSRGGQLLSWTRSLLTAHAGYLLGVPGLVAALEPLYTLVDARLAVLKKLLKLQGRLDLLLAQVAASAGKAGSGAAASGRTLRKARLRVAQEQLEAQAALGMDDDEDDDEEEEDEEEEEGDEDDEEEDEEAGSEDDDEGESGEEDEEDEDEEEDDE